MAILFMGNTAGEFGSGTDVATATYHDSTYVNNAVSYADNVPGPNIGLPSGQADVWFHFDIYGQQSFASSDGFWFTIGCNDGIQFHGDILNGQIIYKINNEFGSQLVAATAITIPWTTSVHTVDFHCQLNVGGNDVFTIYHNGILYASISTSHDVTATEIQNISFANNDVNAPTYYSQFIIADESTVGLKLTPLMPDSAGTASAWTGGFADVLNINDGKAIYTDTAGDRISFNLEAYIGPVDPVVKGVYVQSYAHKGLDGGPTGIQHTLEVSSTVYDGVTHANPEFGVPIVTGWTTNPNTAAAWDDAAFNTLIAGLEAIA